MSFADVKNKIILTGFSAAEEATILAAMGNLLKLFGRAKSIEPDPIGLLKKSPSCFCMASFNTACTLHRFTAANDVQERMEA